MDGLNPILLQMAQRNIWGALTEKTADDPSMGGGMAPPQQGPPPTPQQQPPGPPASPPGMQVNIPPPMDPATAAMGGQPGMGGGMPQQQVQQKVKPEQWMQMLDFRLYNVQQQLTAIMNAFKVELPAGALILPPGSPAAPPPETAMPGGSQDPSAQAGAQQSAISPIDPIQGASPELAGGQPKQGSERVSIGQPMPRSADDNPFRGQSVQTGVAAMAAIMRARAQRAG